MDRPLVARTPVYGIADDQVVPFQIVIWTLLVMVCTAVSLRVYVRACILQSLSWDDGLMLLALGAFLALAIFCKQLLDDVHRLYADASVAEIETGIEDIRNGIIAYSVGQMCLKASLCLFFLRFRLERWQRVAMIVAVVIHWLYTLPYMLVAISQCGSFSFSKDITNYLEGKCLPWSTLGTLNYVGTALNCITDWVFVLIPLRVVANSKLDRRQKLASLCLVGVGLLGSLCSVIRFAFISDLNAGASNLISSGIGLSSVVELGLGMFAACLATLKPLFASFYAAARTTRSKLLPSKNSKNTETVGSASVAEPCAVPGVGILSRFMERTGVSTVSSMILNRIRSEDFAIYDAEDLASHTRSFDGGNAAPAGKGFGLAAVVVQTIHEEEDSGLPGYGADGEELDGHVLQDRLSIRSFENEASGGYRDPDLER